MSIQYKFFIIPIKNSNEMETELNKFLRSFNIINIQREFISHGENSFWSMAIEYFMSNSGTTDKETNKSKVDYRDVLKPEDFVIFVSLREWRKEIARQEAVPVYTIFTNEQLAKIAERRIMTKAKLKEIEGIGDARIEKYGDKILKIVADEIGKQQQK